MKVTKTTRLLAKPLIVSLTDIGVIAGITLAISADNPQGISGYEAGTMEKVTIAP